MRTRWYDFDGSPLPEKLPGFAGRLARIVEDGIYNFEIPPGTFLRQLSLPSDYGKAHFYIHVNGAPPARGPDFKRAEPGATTNTCS